MTPDEIIREGRQLSEDDCGTLEFAARGRTLLSAALDALEEATKRAEIAEAYAGDVQRYREMVLAAEDRAERAARAESALAKAEAERDEARKRAVDEISHRWVVLDVNSKREYAASLWGRDAADRLFPKEGSNG